MEKAGNILWRLLEDIVLSFVKPAAEAVLPWLRCVATMSVPIWFLIILGIGCYIYVWRQAMRRWQIENSIGTLWFKLKDIRERFFATQQLDEQMKRELGDSMKWEKLFDWGPPSPNCRPHLFKPHRW